jgi:hypothetical protein
MGKNRTRNRTSVRNKAIVGMILFIAVAIALAAFFYLGDLRRACTPVPDRDQRSYNTSMELFGRANEAFSSRNYPVANDLLDLAILSLGNSYATPSSVDDSGMVLLAARKEVARSDFQMAARMKQGALNTRLSLFRKKTEMARRCQAVLKRVSQ